LEKLQENLDAADIVLQHILQHFWSTADSKYTPCVKLNVPATSSRHVDSSEFQAIKYHGAWSIKRSRDEIKRRSGNIIIKQSPKDPSEVIVTKEDAVALISKLGNDVLQTDYSYIFEITDEVANFFIRLHDIVDAYLSKKSIATQKGSVVTNCLKVVSTSIEIRQIWTTTVRMHGYSRGTQTVVLQYICTFFVKSKQQISREKLGLKPQKISVALREGIKSKKSKKKKQNTTCMSAERSSGKV